MWSGSVLGLEILRMAFGYLALKFQLALKVRTLIPQRRNLSLERSDLKLSLDLVVSPNHK